MSDLCREIESFSKAENVVSEYKNPTKYCPVYKYRNKGMHRTIACG